MSTLQRESTATITDIKTRASIRRRAAVSTVHLTASSAEGRPFEWSVTIGWYDGDRFKCETGCDDDLNMAVERCLGKLKPDPDISEYIGKASGT